MTLPEIVTPLVAKLVEPSFVEEFTNYTVLCLRRCLNEVGRTVRHLAAAQDDKRLLVEEVFLVAVPIESLLDMPRLIGRITRPLANGVSAFDQTRMSFTLYTMMVDLLEHMLPVETMFMVEGGLAESEHIFFITYGFAEADLLRLTQPYAGTTVTRMGGYHLSAERLYDTAGKVMKKFSRSQTADEADLLEITAHHRKRKLHVLAGTDGAA